jgi:hypothetical protein
MAEFLTTEIADKYKPAFRRGFVDAINAAKQSVSLAKMEDGLRRMQDPGIDWNEFQQVLAEHVIPLIETVVKASGEAHVPPNIAKVAHVDDVGNPANVVERVREGSFDWRKDRIAVQYGDTAKQNDPQPIPLPAAEPTFTFSFDITNPEAVTWIRAHAAELVADVTDETRMAIRALVQRSFQEGIAPRKLARMIREHIGLTRVHSNALFNYQNSLEEAITEGSQAAFDRAPKLFQRYHDRLLRYRANNIARTETITASAEGQKQLWSQMEGQGFLDKDDGYKAWLVTRDERLCPICAPIPTMNGPIPRKDAFKTPRGDMMGPPAHPQCRCSWRLHFKKNGKFPDAPPMPAGWTQVGDKWVPPTPRPTRRLKPRIPR